MRESVHRPFKKITGFLAAFLLTQMDRILADFHSRMWGLLFLALVLQAGELGLGLCLLEVQGRGLCSQDSPSDS